jgi:uncharacterized RDD family membrane protein YckC
MTSPAGWHPDPAPPPSPYHPPQLRYWDGQQWTEHTAPVPVVAYAAPGKATTTPDGVPLAGWWERVGASLIDGVCLLPFYVLAWAPFLPHVIDVYRDYFDKLQAANDNGTSPPSGLELQTHLFGTLALVGLIILVFDLLWTFVWLRWKQATPGKLALGLRIRLREQPGPLSNETIFRRWLAQFGIVGIFGLIPFVGSITGLYSLLDDLWPLWDDQRQAIHDKFARTNVVRVR